MPQEGRRFAGTLRENLVLGLTDPGDDAIMQAAARTGLLDAVIAADPRGLERSIAEGGLGLSGGQRQLVHITRALLRLPTIWLLDEPTASMDQGLEVKVIQMLQDELKARGEKVFAQNCAACHQANGLGVIVAHGISGGVVTQSCELVAVADVAAWTPGVTWKETQAPGADEGAASWHTTSGAAEKLLARDSAT